MVWRIRTIWPRLRGVYCLYSKKKLTQRGENNVNSTHWKTEAPIDPGWYWYRARSRRAQMLRIDSHGLVNLPEEFDGRRATELVGDWYMPQIKPSV
jgi:hypothetical protein